MGRIDLCAMCRFQFREPAPYEHEFPHHLVIDNSDTDSDTDSELEFYNGN